MRIKQQKWNQNTWRPEIVSRHIIQTTNVLMSVWHILNWWSQLKYALEFQRREMRLLVGPSTASVVCGLYNQTQCHRTFEICLNNGQPEGAFLRSTEQTKQEVFSFLPSLQKHPQPQSTRSSLHNRSTRPCMDRYQLTSSPVRWWNPSRPYWRLKTLSVRMLPRNHWGHLGKFPRLKQKQTPGSSAEICR